MTIPAANAIPIGLRDGWPDPCGGGVIGTREASTLFGEVDLSEEELTAVALGTASSIRIDEHRRTEVWRTETGRWFWRRFTETTFEIPVEPVTVPPSAFKADFGDWIRNTHGSNGRLLVWSDVGTWWFVYDNDLEITITCGPPGMFMDMRERTSAWEASPSARIEIDALPERYDFEWDID